MRKEQSTTLVKKYTLFNKWNINANYIELLDKLQKELSIFHNKAELLGVPEEELLLKCNNLFKTLIYKDKERYKEILSNNDIFITESLDVFIIPYDYMYNEVTVFNTTNYYIVISGSVIERYENPYASGFSETLVKCLIVPFAKKVLGCTYVYPYYDVNYCKKHNIHIWNADTFIATAEEKYMRNKFGEVIEC